MLLYRKEFALFQVHPQDMDRYFKRCIMMPSYVNIGAMLMLLMVDTRATVGSRASTGDVHPSGGVGIGGVLEPLQPCNY
jgi:2,3,4,5-tetrahydropyridine-2,6-dicarboxylate N-succinyltransferase